MSIFILVEALEDDRMFTICVSNSLLVEHLQIELFCHDTRNI